MKAEILRTIKLGDGTILGKGTIISEPFPMDVKKELASPSYPPLAQAIPEPPKLVEKEEVFKASAAVERKLLKKKVVG